MIPGEEKVATVMCKSRSWEDLNPEILASIFVRIPADEMVRIVPFVCKSWMEAVAGPYCWRNIDVQEWCRRRKDSAVVNVTIRKLVRRSKCTFQLLSAYRLGNPSFVFVANRARCLTVLKMPKSEITDNVVLNHVKSLSNLRELDISYCSNITVKGLEAFGNQCTSLVWLKRNKSPQRTWTNLGWSISCINDDSEAKIIANTMSNLQHLELCYGSFGNAGLSEILAKCKSLTHLDILGSRHVRLYNDLLESVRTINYFGFPYVDCVHDFSDSEDSLDVHDFSDSEDSL